MAYVTIFKTQPKRENKQEFCKRIVNLLNEMEFCSDDDIYNNGEKMLNIMFKYSKFNSGYDSIDDLLNESDKNYSNILMFSNDDFLAKGINLYGLLAESDALITDFSSVFADYLLTDKPIAFDLSGYDNYASGDGFNVENPISLLPGKLIYTADDLKNFITDTVNGNDEFISRRNNEKNKLHKYQDGKSAERILKYFGIIK